MLFLLIKALRDFQILGSDRGMDNYLRIQYSIIINFTSIIFIYIIIIILVDRFLITIIT